jgi:hypothetical protein
MAKHTISEAARITGKSRSTIHRHIKTGILSKTLDDSGSPVIDTSELQRVYGSLSHRDSSSTPSVIHDDTQKNDRATQVEIEALRRENESLRQERDRWASQAERLTLLLTHQEAPRSASWVARLFGSK